MDYLLCPPCILVSEAFRKQSDMKKACSTSAQFPSPEPNLNWHNWPVPQYRGPIFEKISTNIREDFSDLPIKPRSARIFPCKGIRLKEEDNAKPSIVVKPLEKITTVAANNNLATSSSAKEPNIIEQIPEQVPEVKPPSPKKLVNERSTSTNCEFEVDFTIHRVPLNSITVDKSNMADEEEPPLGSNINEWHQLSRLFPKIQLECIIDEFEKCRKSFRRNQCQL